MNTSNFTSDRLLTIKSVPVNSIKIVFECSSHYSDVWITIFVLDKIILVMYGIYLAWIIRNINVAPMNDSKYLFLSSYSIIVNGLGSMTLMQLLRDWPNVVQIFFTLGIIVTTCSTQCLLFVPKVYDYTIINIEILRHKLTWEY